MSRIPVAILISGGGSNMAALLRDMEKPDHPARACLVLSNRPDAGGLALAKAAGVPALAVDHKAYANKLAFEAALDLTLDEAGARILCLAGFMRVLSSEFVQRRAGRILNIHPSLLPLFPGLDTHGRALAAGVAIHGATVHEVTADVDAGAILGQAAVPVLASDTAETLAARVLPAEHRLYAAVLRRFAVGNRVPIAVFPE